jgi:hypothetical protein
MVVLAASVISKSGKGEGTSSTSVTCFTSCCAFPFGSELTYGVDECHQSTAKLPSSLTCVSSSPEQVSSIRPLNGLLCRILGFTGALRSEPHSFMDI